ncbi:hypothetical protein OROGR_005854 [Orobanche gracilis]
MRYDDGNLSGTSTRRRRRRPRKTRNETCRNFSCMPPWFILWRWFNGGETGDLRNRFMGRKFEKEKVEGNSRVNKRRNGNIKDGSRDCEAPSSCRDDEDDDVSAEIVKEATINLGVGIGLIYFVRLELNKMLDLRRNIELLLQEFRKQVEDQKNEPLSMPSQSCISSSFSNNEISETNSNQHLSPHDAERPASATCSSNVRYGLEKSSRMDELEAELEAEFNRLQIYNYKYPKQHYSEVTVEDSAPAPDLSLDMCHEGDNAGGAHDEPYRVPPRELERKLHEVLETRQEERISELESALEYTMQQLGERERELACWKDAAARLVSRRFPSIPDLDC